MSGLGVLSNVTENTRAVHWARKSDERATCKSIYGEVGRTWGSTSQAESDPLSVGPLVHSGCGSDNKQRAEDNS
jgi:hypothetical protein